MRIRRGYINTWIEIHSNDQITLGLSAAQYSQVIWIFDMF